MKRDKVLYIEEKPVSARKKKRRRYRFFNILMLVLAAYFVVTIARQEFELREIQRKTQEANAQYAELKQEEGILNKKIADAASTHMVENKAKSILGWVGEDEFKVIENKE